MPYELSIFQLPDGRRCGRVTLLGVVTEEDADAILADNEPGGHVYGLPALVLGHQMTHLSPQARAVFSSARSIAFTTKMAMVVPNPVLRVTANFVLRIRRSHLQRMFGTEAEAVSWLTEKSS
ncbi:MAG TPA: hypothetical protein VFA20_13235 [Myxococcaceae bacterium]|nr:hypothetical protein [Myxococcaceae bacterium]